ncbi:MAG: acylphosphatase [Candidatus Altiarchaeales archaeon]|nr:acylphosphatase [Candidatus Altiarchaeales archaeon]
MASARAHVFVSGRVQGVFYRSNARTQARLRGLAGFVRNLSDGKVEAVFEGEESVVKDMLKWCRQGPEYANVENVELSWEKPTGEFKSFEVRY